jgi:hypothetical protein
LGHAAIEAEDGAVEVISAKNTQADQFVFRTRQFDELGKIENIRRLDPVNRLGRILCCSGRDKTHAQGTEKEPNHPQCSLNEQRHGPMGKESLKVHVHAPQKRVTACTITLR